MYADNTNITYAGKDVKEINDYLNKDLKSINTWLSANKFTLNLTKTEFLVITSRQRRVYSSDNPSLTIHNFPIEQVSSTKSLGVDIDPLLNIFNGLVNPQFDNLTNLVSQDCDTGISANRAVSVVMRSCSPRHVHSP